MRVPAPGIVGIATTCAALLTLAFGGCGSHGSSPAPSPTFTIQTPTVTVAAGQEKYVCYAQTLTEDLTVDRYDYAVVPFVHHVFFSRDLAPEPEGLSECDVLFKTSWIPLLVAGKGNATLQDPAGAASVLPKGTQLVVQLHLLNPSTSEASATVSIDMHRSTLDKPKPVGLYAFGTQVISLPPNATTSVSYECTPAQDVVSFTDFPHMHRLGTKLTFEVADATGAYHQAYARDPYDFNNQYLEPTPLSVLKGTKTRITCTYDNTTTGTVVYGESTNDEMCFFAMFVAGLDGTAGCIQSPAGDAGADAGTCMATANSIGVGAPCTAGGGQCPSGLQCSTDLQASANPAGFCMKVGCMATADCGSQATCCAPAGGGGVQVCLPNACVPPTCAVK
jgi:hypothetical protein